MHSSSPRTPLSPPTFLPDFYASFQVGPRYNSTPNIHLFLLCRSSCASLSRRVRRLSSSKKGAGFNGSRSLPRATIYESCLRWGWCWIMWDGCLLFFFQVLTPWFVEQISKPHGNWPSLTWCMHKVIFQMDTCGLRGEPCQYPSFNGAGRTSSLRAKPGFSWEKYFSFGYWWQNKPKYSNWTNIHAHWIKIYILHDTMIYRYAALKVYESYLHNSFHTWRLALQDCTQAP